MKTPRETPREEAQREKGMKFLDNNLFIIIE